MKTSVKYLGHVIDARGLHTIQKKIEAVLKIPVPNNIHQLRSYLSLNNYYGKFITNMSEICNPFYELLKTDVRFKKMLSSSPVNFYIVNFHIVDFHIVDNMKVDNIKVYNIRVDNKSRQRKSRQYKS